MTGMYDDTEYVNVVDEKGRALPPVPKSWVKAGLLPEGVEVGSPDDAQDGDVVDTELAEALEQAEAAVKAAEERADAAEKARGEAEAKAEAAVKAAEDLKAQLAAAQAAPASAKPAAGTAAKK